MLADGKKMLNVEVGLNEKIVTEVKEQGQLIHTNHLMAPELLSQNKKIGSGSVTRYKRLEELLSKLPSLQMEEMKKISLDKNAGPDASLWRTGSTPKKTRTLSAWIVEYSQTASPTLYLHLANPGKPETEEIIKIDSEFWKKASSSPSRDFSFTQQFQKSKRP